MSFRAWAQRWGLRTQGPAPWGSSEVLSKSPRVVSPSHSCPLTALFLARTLVPQRWPAVWQVRWDGLPAQVFLWVRGERA